MISQLYLLNNVPLNNNYSDTFTFNNKDEQFSFFTKFAKFPVFDDFSYIRNSQTTYAIRVDINADALYDCNYLVYKNEDKFYYNFITQIEYKNENLTYIHFNEDILQTWFFEFDIKPCFVEREHTNNDSIGANTYPENLELGDYITTSESNYNINFLTMIILATEPPEGLENFYFSDPVILGGIPMPCYWCNLGIANDVNLQTLKNIVDNYNERGKIDSIVAIFMAPYGLVSHDKNIKEKTLNGAPRTLSYTPKNNKLYTYPYCGLSVVTTGQSVTLHYEHFTGPPVFKLRSGFGVNNQISCTPQNYEGQTESFVNQVTLKDFPLVPWTSNYYQNWVAQNKANMISGAIGATLSVVSNLSTGNVTGAVTGAADFANNMLAQHYNASIVPDQMHGNASAADINAVSQLLGFYTMCRSIKPEYIKKIDSFFTKFGYKTCITKVPNITGRKSWNYIKTLDAKVIGRAPQFACMIFEEILNKGITFWHNSDIGNYEQSNNII